MLSRKFGYVGVVNSIPGSSAHKAGLGTGDMLESIAGVATRDMPLAYAEMLLQGDPGSSVEITALRVRKPEPQKISLTRGIVHYPSITSKLLPDGIGLVQIPALDGGRLKEITSQVDSLLKQGAKKLILDLRNSSVGSPEDGAAVANLFIDKGVITYSQGQKYPRKDINADGKAPYKNQPIAVITNRGTANAAEILAASLLDSKRAEVVGERSYGDAAIRKPITLDDGAAVILSVAKYYSPSGKAIQDTGVTPSVLVTDVEPVVEQDETDAQQNPAPDPPKNEEDILLKKAVEVLTKGKTATATNQGTSPADKALPASNPLLIK
jgi:carboxyl-terminal processing protease